MKICLISNLYAPHIRGGAERVVAQLARDLSARGHDVHVITSAPWREVGFGSTQRLEHGVKVHRLFHWCFYFNLTSGHQPFFLRAMNLIWSHLNIPFAWHTIKIAQELKPDVVHTHNLSGTSFLIPVFLRATGVK
ncbi:MAG: glycosyltransferase, partial [Candidatus Magasanikbacteria bacterium]|nr:glycosyltransferase [Candidatus Magasanikbacteria bacterium]